MDVSADLTELSRTPLAVVSAGVKSILDIPRTLEVLHRSAPLPSPPNMHSKNEQKDTHLTLSRRTAERATWSKFNPSSVRWTGLCRCWKH